MSQNYREKYLKYKTKYLQLKNLIGQGNGPISKPSTPRPPYANINLKSANELSGVTIESQSGTNSLQSKSDSNSFDNEIQFIKIIIEILNNFVRSVNNNSDRFVSNKLDKETWTSYATKTLTIYIRYKYTLSGGKIIAHVTNITEDEEGRNIIKFNHNGKAIGANYLFKYT